MEIARFVEETLRRTDCMTEVPGSDLVHALMPAPVAAALGLPEEARLRVRGAPASGEVHAGFGTVLLTQICSLAEGTGRRYRVELVPALPKGERVEREAKAALTFRNAVGRFDSLEDTLLEYLVVDFRYAALSEESHEGLLAVAVGLEGSSSPGLAAGLHAYLSEHPEVRRPWSAPGDSYDVGRAFQAARPLALALAMAGTEPLRARLTRRLLRDTRRVGEYYEALRGEVASRRARGRETPQLLNEKLAAIDAEMRRRRQDLVRRHTLTLRLEPLAVVAVRVRGLRVRCRLKRRKQERQAILGWNPVARRLDRWLCAGCGAEAPLPAVCDRLHVLCSACPPECPSCGKPACPACRPLPCPCGRHAS